MTLPRFDDLIEYWLEHPPAHVTLSAITGLFRGGQQKSKQASDDEYEAPELETTNDVTSLANNPMYSDQFPVRKMEVITIDRRTKVG